MKNKTVLNSDQQEDLIRILKDRFINYPDRHQGMLWEKIEEKLHGHPDKLWSLSLMEETGGEPDVIAYDKKDDQYIFADCSAESPKGRRSLCYDKAALEARKEHKPKNNVMDVATEMGIELLTEEEYRELQKLGAFDNKTSSWIRTPASIRKLGGALFCDRRYEQVFTYHNGAESYYAARGFRASLRV